MDEKLMAYDTPVMEPDETIQEALEKLRDRRDLLAHEVDEILRMAQAKVGHIEKLERAIDALTQIVGAPPDEEEGIHTDIVDRVRTFRPQGPAPRPVMVPDGHLASEGPPASPDAAAPGEPQFQRPLKARMMDVIEARGARGITVQDLIDHFPDARVATLKAYLGHRISERLIVQQGDTYVAKAHAGQATARAA